jgi:hypothetical protein
MLHLFGIVLGGMLLICAGSRLVEWLFLKRVMNNFFAMAAVSSAWIFIVLAGLHVNALWNGVETQNWGMQMFGFAMSALAVPFMRDHMRTRLLRRKQQAKPGAYF